jgi:hypothetical protein
MQPRRFYLTICVILTFIFAASGLAGAGILDKASQMVNLNAGGTGTTVLLSAFVKVNPDGTSVAFDPGSNVVVVSKIMWRFKPDTPSTNPIQLRLTENPFSASGVSFYSKMSSYGGDGYAAENDNVTPGIPVKVQDASAWGFYVVDLVTNLPVSGSFGIRLVGFLAPNQ